MNDDIKNTKEIAGDGVPLAAAVALVSLSSFGFLNAIAATATMNIFARIIRPVEIAINTSMDFGMLAITRNRVGKATIDPLSDNLFIDSRGSLALAGGLPRAGRMHIKGSFSPVSVTMEKTQIDLTNGSTFLVVDDFNFVTVNGASGDQITVTPTGTLDTVVLAVGATLNSREGQLTGTYVGSNRVFANYQ